MSDETNPIVDPTPAPARIFLGEPAPVENPLVGKIGNPSDANPAMANPAPAKPIDGPIVHGEAAQRFVNKNAAHSERVMQGKVVTPPVRKERYEHPERKA